MAPSLFEAETSDETSNKPIHQRPTTHRQSSKRHNDTSEEEICLSEDLPAWKRACHNSLIQCPLASIGCLSEISDGDLENHYQTQMHQKFVMKLIDLIKQQPHNQSVTSNNNQNHSDLIETVNLLQASMECLHDDSIRMQTDIFKTESAISEQGTQMEQIQNSVEETNKIVQASQMNMNILEAEFEELKQKVAELQSQLSNDGSYIWKITGVAKKLKDAMTEKQISIYSPPFYSSSTGYKMCMRLYLHGDGHARRTHASLFFVIMRGNYDNILQWPFNHKITFCLYDQSGKQNHIIDSFIPNINSNSFKQPCSNMNIASGIPKFCKLETIQQDNSPYIRDDCMFIRCMVNFASTPKTLIPFVCNINPGLPVLNQRTIIRTEIDRQSKLTSNEKKT